MTTVAKYTYRSLFLLLPLIFYKNTSELFEFNKLTLLYTGSAIIFSIWIVYSYTEKKLFLEKNVHSKALFLFLIALTLSTFTSIDIRTSIFGYYSRFSGGLISIIALSVLSLCYPIFVNKREVKLHILLLLISSIIVSLWGIAEHFSKSPSCILLTGSFDAECWVQDVVNRVFASFGQPNWMAAWLSFAIPIGFAYQSQNKSMKFRSLLVIIPSLFVLALLFTKSRSGILATITALAIFIALTYTRGQKETFKKLHLQFFAIVALVIFFGTPWTGSLESKLTENNKIAQQELSVAPKLETGGTESGEIRKIVWTGAFKVFAKYPILGSGLETFAMSYYEGRPVSHNTTSEWNYLYNKAHNEYLNYLATTGVVGFTSYILLVLSIVFYSFPRKKDDVLVFSLFAGFVGLLVSNFFGFATSTTLFLFFMTPAMTSALRQKEEVKLAKKSNNHFYLMGLTASVLIFLISRYWYADFLYASAKSKLNENDPVGSIKKITKAIEISPTEPIYHDMMGQAMTSLALSTENIKDVELYLNQALSEVKTVEKLSPRNIKLAKSQINTLSDLANLNPDTLLIAKRIADDISGFAPTDPSIPYQRGLIAAKLGFTDEAIVYIKKAIDLKPNYKIARQLLAYLYAEKGMNNEAKEQYVYILEFISPEDNSIKEELDKLL